MDKTVKLIKDIIKLDVIVLLIVAGISAIIFENKLEILKGFLFGGLIGILMFVLLARTMQKASGMHPINARKYATKQYFLRMIIYALVIFIGLKADYLNSVSVIVGLLSIKFVIYFKEVFCNKEFIRKIFSRKEDD